jgi:hypothetical protein
MSQLNGDLHLALKILIGRDHDAASRNALNSESSATTQAHFTSNLSISDPAGNVIHDLSACVLLEDRLVNEKTSVATVQALYDHATHRHPQLKTILGSVSIGKSLKFAIDAFRNLFQSLFKPTKRTKAMVSILAASELSSSAAIKTKAAIKAAAAARFQDLSSLAINAAETGCIPVVDSALKTLTLTQLPGIAELQSYKNPVDIETHWAAIETFIVNAVCYVRFEKQELLSARNELQRFEASSATDKYETVALYEDLFDVCTSWFGAPIETDYDKIQRFVSKCPTIVRTEYANEITLIKLDELRMTWDGFQPVLSKVWEAAFSKQQLYSDLGLGTTLPSKQIAANTQHLSAINLTCSVCSTTFEFTAKQQSDYKTKDYSQPKKCKQCRESDSTNHDKACDNFSSNGTCSFGDSCKYRHAPATFSGRRLPQLLPGEIKKPCRAFKDTGQCSAGDKCTHQHPGREYYQKAAAAAVSSANAENRDTVSEWGHNPLTKRK